MAMMDPNDELVETKEFQPLDFNEETREISRRLGEWTSGDDSERMATHGRLIARNGGTWNSGKIGGFTFCPFPHHEGNWLVARDESRAGNNAAAMARQGGQKPNARQDVTTTTRRTKEGGQKASKCQLLGVDNEPVLVLKRDQFQKPAKEQQSKTARDVQARCCANRDGSVAYKHGAAVEQVLQEYRQANMYSRARLTKVNKRELASAIMSVRPPHHESSGAELSGDGGDDIFTRLSQPMPTREDRPFATRQPAPRSSGGPFLQVCSLSFGSGQAPAPAPRSKLTALRDSPPPSHGLHQARSLDSNGLGGGAKNDGPISAEGGDGRTTYSLLLAEQTRVMEARAKCLLQQQQLNAERDSSQLKTTMKHLLKTETGPIRMDPIRADSRTKMRQTRTSETPPRPEPRYRVTLDFDGPTRGRGGRVRCTPEQQRSKPRGGGKNPAKKEPADKTSNQLFLSGVPIEPARTNKTFKQEKSKLGRGGGGQVGGTKRTSPNALGFKITNESLRRDEGVRGEEPQSLSKTDDSEEITEILSPRFGPDDRPQSDNEVIIRGYLGLRDDPRDDFDIILDRETFETLNDHTQNEIAMMSEVGTGTANSDDGRRHRDAVNQSRSEPTYCDPSPLEPNPEQLFARCRELQSKLRSDPLLATVGEHADEVSCVRPSFRHGDDCKEVAGLLDRLDIDCATPLAPVRRQIDRSTAPDHRGRALQSSYLRKYGGTGVDRLLLNPGDGDRREERHPNSPMGEDTAGSHTIACGSDEPFEPYPTFGLGGDRDLILDTKYPKKNSINEPMRDGSNKGSDLGRNDYTGEATRGISLGGKSSNPFVVKAVRFSEPEESVHDSGYENRGCEVKNSMATTDLSDRSDHGGFNSATQLASLAAAGSTSKRYMDYLKATTLVDVGVPPVLVNARLDVTRNRGLSRSKATMSVDSGLSPTVSNTRLDVIPNRNLSKSRAKTLGVSVVTPPPGPSNTRLDITPNRTLSKSKAKTLGVSVTTPPPGPSNPRLNITPHRALSKSKAKMLGVSVTTPPSIPRLDITPNHDLADEIAIDARSSGTLDEGGLEAQPQPTRYTELTQSYADLLSKLKQVNEQYKPKKKR